MIDLTNDVLWSVHPIASKQFRDLATYLVRSYEEGETHTLFKPHKGFRSPGEQQVLFAKRPAVTKAGPWKSAHNYGLAIDFVPQERGAWSWDEKHDYMYLAKAAQVFGLSVPIEWDRVHVQHPVFRQIASILQI